MAIGKPSGIVAVVALGLVCCARAATGQTVSGSLFAGAGAFVCCEGHAIAWDAGGGVDVPLGGGASGVGDFQAIVPFGDGRVPQQFGYASFGSTILISFGGAYHIRLRAARVHPFLTAGLGIGTRANDAGGGLYFGGGLDRWVRERQGIRVEIRDQLFGSFSITHVISARIGLIVR
jgi:hypothetical protein